MRASLSGFLKRAEVVALVMIFIGIVLKVLHLAGANELLMVSLLALSTIYVLNAFVLTHLDDGKQKGFADRLPAVLWKAMYIGLSVFLVGFLFAILHLAGTGELLLIGVGTLVITVFMSMTLILGKRERMGTLKAPLIRSVLALLYMLLLNLIAYLR